MPAYEWFDRRSDQSYPADPKAHSAFKLRPTQQMYRFVHLILPNVSTVSKRQASDSLIISPSKRVKTLYPQKRIFREFYAPNLTALQDKDMVVAIKRPYRKFVPITDSLTEIESSDSVSGAKESDKTQCLLDSHLVYDVNISQ